jgi:hypothetical protein
VFSIQVERNVLAVMAILTAALAVGPAVFGQTSAGRITGVVLDSSGALIPNAQLTARNVETGLESKTSSNTEGNYALYPLPPGVYEIAAAAPGFRNERLEGIRPASRIDGVAVGFRPYWGFPT